MLVLICFAWNFTFTHLVTAHYGVARCPLPRPSI